MTPLAQATQTAHLRLHEAGPFHKIAEGCFGAEEVGLALALHLRAWRHVVGWEAGDWLSAPARTFFRLDLFAEAAEQLGTPVLPPPEIAQGASAFLAAGYVYLGSQKGGVTLSRCLREAGYGCAAACFAPSASHRRDWDLLMGRIDALPPRDFQDVCTSANQWFASFDFEAPASAPHSATSCGVTA